MAGVLESLTVPRAAGFTAATLTPTGSSSTRTLSGRRRSVNLQKFMCLKIQSSYVNSSRGFANGRLSLRGSRIACEAQETTVEVSPVTDSNWQSLVLESTCAVVVQFWAPWCGPCRMIHPVIDELAKQYAGKLKFYKVNTDESPSIATRYGIRSIPTVMIFKDGEKKDSVIGAVPKSTLNTTIDKFL